MKYTTNRELIKKSRVLRKNMTKAEEILWSELRLKKIGFKFRRQFPIYDFIVDFYSYELNLIIEIDGPIHNDEKSNSYDLKRDNLLRLNNYRILRLSNDEIITDLNGSLIRIKDFIKHLLVPQQGGPQGVIKH
jgi:very-short-patch-repair endonuclease